MSHPILALLAVGLGCLLTVDARAQTTDRRPGTCFRGRPAAACRAFWITEAGYYVRLVSSEVDGVLPPAPPTVAHLNSHASWEIGGMVNRGPGSAVGATVLLGGDDLGVRVGVKGRYRRWLGARQRAADFSAGILRAYSTATYPDIPAFAYGVTGDVTLGVGDLAGVSARADLLRSRNARTVSAVYGGVRLGSYAAVAATAVGAVVAVIGLFTAPAE